MSIMMEINDIQKKQNLYLMQFSHESAPLDAVVIVSDIAHNILKKASTQYRRDAAFQSNKHLFFQLFE